MGDASRPPRLPTRCPICRSSGIFRMPSKTGPVLWFYCAFCKHTWKFRPDDAEHA